MKPVTKYLLPSNFYPDIDYENHTADRVQSRDDFLHFFMPKDFEHSPSDKADNRARKYSEKGEDDAYITRKYLIHKNAYENRGYYDKYLYSAKKSSIDMFLYGFFIV